jgi:hypothetical protein
MITTLNHPTPADLIWYATTDDPSDARVRSVRDHLESGCEICVSAVRRFKEISIRHPFHQRISVLQPGWIVPMRIAVPNDRARGAAGADLHLICGAGPYELDILMRERERAAQLEMAGQVTWGGSIYEPVSGLDLELVEARVDQSVTATQTDEFGEFDLLSPSQGVYGVRLGEAEDAPCVLVWDGEHA